jgi:hypothetical protein
MGQWISGSHPNMPKLSEVLADYYENGQRKGAVQYFENNPKLKDLLDRKRPLNPSFHLQFSEMLGTFSNVCARRIVEAFDGCLIYSGGDDVLAMLPAKNAVACAKALRAAFRGTMDLNRVKGGWEVDAERGHREPNRNLSLFNITQEGFIQLHKDNHLVMASEPKNFPAIVPGPAADCSVGIAIDHFKSPLQDVVRAAQAAEKRAKKQLGRAAVAISLFKRSGEITEWGTKWENGGLALYQKIAELLESGQLSAKFPHRVCQLLEPYRINATGLMKESATMKNASDFEAHEAIRHEFAFAISRQSASGQAKSNEAELMPLLDSYLKELGSDPQTLLTAVTGLCTTVAFTHRTSADSETNPEPKGQTRP